MKIFSLLANLLSIGTAIYTVNLNAQPVYSVNAVGYINVAIHHGINLVGLQLDPIDHSISALFPNMPEGTSISRAGEGGFTTNVYQNGQWSRPEETFAVGDGAFVINPASEDKVVTFVGEILQGELTNSIPRGLSIRCSMIPEAGKLSQVLGLRLAPFDNVYLVSNGVLNVFTYLPDGKWKPSEPDLQVAESFLVNAAGPLDWAVYFDLIFGLQQSI